jgi:tetratricopeptide (TPR) repeat protein
VRDAEGTSAVASPTSPRPPDTLSALLPDPVALPPVVDDRYELRERLGSGGHGAVYRVWDRVFRHDVALKVLQDASHSETLRARFRREAEVAHRLVHPNLLRVFELRADGPFVYFTMELVDGESLAQRLRDRAALPMDEALRITEHLLTGLAHLHAASLLHRDVKPSNVLLDREGRVKVADLGLVLPIDDELTRLTMTEALLGTLAYLSPEQALNQPPTPASDLYAVGLVLYEMLAGKPPYESGSSLGLLLQRMSRPPATLRVLRPDLPVWLHRVVERLLEPRLEMRYQSAEQVLEDLRRKQVSLSPRRRQQRRRLLLVGAGVFAAATGLWAWISASPELDAETMSLPVLVDLPGNAGLTVIGADGKDLWHAPELELRRTALGWLQPDQPPVAFALAVDPLGGPARLEQRSAWTGAVTRTVDLPSPHYLFPGFSDRFHGNISAIDLDGDGGIELVLDRNHRLYAPTVTGLYEPRLARYREVFAAIGHHRFVGAVDLDGDGAREILIAGVNNVLGWYTGIAAVKLIPPVNDSTARPAGPALSPDRPNAARVNRSLLWYALAPPGTCRSPEGCLQVDHERRLLHFAFAEPWTLDFHGLPPTEPSELDAGERNRRREAAYANLREASRLLEGGDAHTAALVLEQSSHDLAPAGLSQLHEWVNQQWTIALLLSGDERSAEPLLADLYRTPEREVTVAFEVAQALHLAGELERAVTWYQRGIGRGLTDKPGRPIWEYLRGYAFALGELGQWDEALDVLARWGDLNIMNDSPQYAAMLRWRRDGTLTNTEKLTDSPLVVDEKRYISLEQRRVTGTSAADLLRAVDEELTLASYTRPALQSLRSELLASLGQTTEARTEIADAYFNATQTRRQHVVPRFFFPVVEERWRRLGGEVGR